MAWIVPKAIDFVVFVCGKELAWNDPIGLKLRWKAAGLAKSINPIDLRNAAEEVTRSIARPGVEVKMRQKG